MQNKQPENLKRRGFLLSAGIGSAGAVAAVAVGLGKEEPKPTPAASAQKAGGGYEETRHVSNYYRSARV